MLPKRCCSTEHRETTASQRSRESGEDPPRHRGPGSGSESCTAAEGRQAQQVRSEVEICSVVGSIDASDEHLIGTLLGVIKVKDATALPDVPRFEAKAIDEMQGTPWRPPTMMHRETKIRAHMTVDGDQGAHEEEEPEEIQMDIRRGRPGRDSRRHFEEARRHFQQNRAVVQLHHQGTRCAEVRTTHWLLGMQVHIW